MSNSVMKSLRTFAFAILAAGFVVVGVDSSEAASQTDSFISGDQTVTTQNDETEEAQKGTLEQGREFIRSL